VGAVTVAAEVAQEHSICAIAAFLLAMPVVLRGDYLVGTLLRFEEDDAYRLMPN
jgi:hypothetical protein